MAAKQEYVDKTWTDFTKRMKGSQVTPENWTAFYEKYYGFIVCYIRKHSKLNDSQIQSIVDMVVDDIFVKRKLNDYESREGKRFRSWFATLIHRRMFDYYRSLKDDTVSLDEEILENISDPNTESDTYDEKDLWQSYIAYLAIDEARKKSPANQFQCFHWRVCCNKKPADIATVLNMKPEQVSEAVRSFKDKVAHAVKQLGETFDMETVDWKELKQKADAARDMYLKEADDFSLRIMQK